MDAEFLTVRLSKDEAQVIQRLRRKTGLSKSAIVKRALHSLAKESEGDGDAGGLFALGVTRFGRYGNAARQSADIKRVVKSRVRAKRFSR